MGWNALEPVRGVACLVFGIGVSGSRWVTRLARSGWFAGLEPRPEDMIVAGGEAVGCWRSPVSHTRRQCDLAIATRAFFEQGPLPKAPLAAVAVMPDASQTDLAAALGLVAALRERRCERRCRTAVVVTIEGRSSLALLALVIAMRNLGAFVIRAGLEATGNHLHHFPLRAAMGPREGRLICVDLADHLVCWPPGGVADLNVIPSGYDAAERVFSRLADAEQIRSQGAQAINLHLHVNANTPDTFLVEFDRLATSCQDFLLAPGGNLIYTDTARLDGTTTTADLLIV